MMPNFFGPKNICQENFLLYDLFTRYEAFKLLEFSVNWKKIIENFFKNSISFHIKAEMHVNTKENSVSVRSFFRHKHNEVWT